MNNRQQIALLTLGGALAVGVVAQLIVKHEAAALGISMFEIGLVGYVLGAAITRTITR